MTMRSSPFETKTRDAGERFVTLTDDAPEWLQEAVRLAHHDTMPHDWVYAECEAAYDAYQDQEGRPDDHEHTDGRVDVYTKELYAWAADMCLTDLYSEAESRANELGTKCEDTSQRLASIQYCAIELIATVIFDAIEANSTMKDFSRYETIGSFVFKPYLEGKGPVFVLTMWNTRRRGEYGKKRIAYRLMMGDAVLFEGEDYQSHSLDSVEDLMGFLTLKPGDTDEEYFVDYTPEQLAYCEEHAEILSCEVQALYGA